MAAKMVASTAERRVAEKAVEREETMVELTAEKKAVSSVETMVDRTVAC